MNCNVQITGARIINARNLLLDFKRDQLLSQIINGKICESDEYYVKILWKDYGIDIFTVSELKC